MVERPWAPLGSGKSAAPLLPPGENIIEVWCCVEDHTAVQNISERGRKLSRPLTLVFARVTTQPSSVLSLNELLQVSINRDVLSSISISKTLNVYRFRGDLKASTLLFYILCCLGVKTDTHRTKDHLIGFTIYGCRICTICRNPNLVQEWDAREVMGRKQRLEGLFVTLVWDII